MRPIFYSAGIGWILIGVWIAALRVRLRSLEERILEIEHEKTF
jgi:heme exporter protein C